MHLNIPIFFLSGRERKISSNLPFVTLLITVLPGKISSEKKVSKFWSFAELRVFDGTSGFGILLKTDCMQLSLLFSGTWHLETWPV